jgi:hypothetical protein
MNVGPGATVTPLACVDKTFPKSQLKQGLEYFCKIRKGNPVFWSRLITQYF